MRPILMVENVKNLHDARYCAAVGIAMVTFQLDPHDHDALTPAAVREIDEWLSGLGCIGKFTNSSAAEINAFAEAANVGWVQIPLRYDLDEAANLLPGLIFTADNGSRELISRLQEFHATFPDAIFLVDARIPDFGSLLSEHADLLARCILRFDEPDTIYQQLKMQGLQPYGFSLGSFAADDDGLLDYDACDKFIDQYQALVLA